MRLIVHMGWQIEPRSYEAGSNCWWPRALVSIFEGGRLCSHDVRALLSVTFDTAHSANEYAVRMAKRWIEDRYYRPLGSPVSVRRGADGPAMPASSRASATQARVS